MSVSYTYSFKVEKKHIDRLGHVNNVVYLRWVNDASELHWNVLSDEKIRRKYFWVVLRHEIDYLDQAVPGDEIQVRTWVGESSGVKSVRHVEISKRGAILARSRSTWCLIDASTLRPTRIKEDILSLLEPSDQR